MDAVSIAEAARVERIRERQERIQKRLMAKRGLFLSVDTTFLIRLLRYFLFTGTIRDEGLTAESVKPTNAKALQQVSESIKVLDDKKVGKRCLFGLNSFPTFFYVFVFLFCVVQVYFPRDECASYR